MSLPLDPQRSHFASFKLVLNRLHKTEERQELINAWHSYEGAKDTFAKLANDANMISLNGAFANFMRLIWKYEDMR